MSERPVVGVDLGASAIRAAVETPGKTAFVRRRTPTDSPEAVCEAVSGLIETAADEAGVASTRLEAAGVGVAGPLDRTAGTVTPPNLPFSGLPIQTAVESAIDGPVRLVNDTTAAALAVAAATDASDVVYLSLSTGIGAGVIADGEPLEGMDGNAGEVGHTVVEPTGEMPCGCGETGHWEAYCSGRNLPRFARRLAAREGIDTELDTAGLDAATLFEAGETDPLSAATLERFHTYNAVGVANTAAAYAPERIVLGGGITLAHPETVLAPLSDRLPPVVAAPTVSVTELGDRVGAQGAVLAARRETLE